jgi:hypothetical protein
MKLHSFRPTLDEAFEIFADKSEYVVAAPQYRAAANTAMGWNNSNLPTEMTRLLRRAGVSGWPRLFHSMRASRQTELQREFPLHVVCSLSPSAYLLPNSRPNSALTRME